VSSTGDTLSSVKPRDHARGPGSVAVEAGELPDFLQAAIDGFAVPRVRMNEHDTQLRMTGVFIWRHSRILCRGCSRAQFFMRLAP
jgi:hypothetical protein